MIPFLQRAVATAAKTLGELATYATTEGQSLTLRAVVNRDVIAPINSMDSGLAERRTVIYVETAKLAGHVPQRNDLISVGVETWRVLAIEQDDGYLIQLKVVARP